MCEHSDLSDRQQQDQQWMKAAMKLAARAGEADEVPVGAVIVLDNEIVAEGWNQPISGHDPTAHAEIIALRAAAEKLENYRLPECTLYVTVEPCTMCAGAIVHARINRLVFGALEPKAGAVVSNACVFDQPYLNHRVEYTGGVFAAECGELMAAFFRQKRQRLKQLRKHSS